MTKIMGIEVGQVWNKIQCAFCLNTNVSHKKIIEGKQAPTGDVKDDKGQAVAFLCADHKEQEPKFAHQITEGKVINVNVAELQDLPPAKETAKRRIQEEGDR